MLYTYTPYSIHTEYHSTGIHSNAQHFILYHGNNVLSRVLRRRFAMMDATRVDLSARRIIYTNTTVNRCNLRELNDNRSCSLS